MAAHAGCSPDHLTRTARSAGINLKEVNDWWRVLLAVVDRSEVETWERVAMRLGYSAGPGLSALFRRTLGAAPTSWGVPGAEEMEVVLDRLGRVFDGDRIW